MLSVSLSRASIKENKDKSADANVYFSTVNGVTFDDNLLHIYLDKIPIFNMGGGNRHKDKKKYHVQYAKNARRAKYQMVPDIQGFLCFTNRREKETVKEAYTLLGEYADKMFGPENQDDQRDPANDEEEDHKDEDIDAALEREKKALDEIKTKKVEERRFQVSQEIVRVYSFCSFFFHSALISGAAYIGS